MSEGRNTLVSRVPQDNSSPSMFSIGAQKRPIFPLGRSGGHWKTQAAPFTGCLLATRYAASTLCVGNRYWIVSICWLGNAINPSEAEQKD